MLIPSEVRGNLKYRCERQSSRFLTLAKTELPSLTKIQLIFAGQLGLNSIKKSHYVILE